VSDAFWRPGPEGLSVAVKVTPRARTPGLRGVVAGADGARLAIAVTAAPEDGAANRAVCATLARALDVPPSAVSVITGAAAREKRLAIAGDLAILTARIAAL
jgi:uncharacterized protein YggU (UPF0235/DUF167 family)